MSGEVNRGSWFFYIFIRRVIAINLRTEFVPAGASRAFASTLLFVGL